MYFAFPRGRKQEGMSCQFRVMPVPCNAHGTGKPPHKSPLQRHHQQPRGSDGSTWTMPASHFHRARCCLPLVRGASEMVPSSAPSLELSDSEFLPCLPVAVHHSSLLASLRTTSPQGLAPKQYPVILLSPLHPTQARSTQKRLKSITSGC